MFRFANIIWLFFLKLHGCVFSRNFDRSGIIEAKYGVKITRKFAQFVEGGHAPAPTPTDAPLIGLLKKAMKEVMPIEPRVGGVGGGTCAAYFRGKGIPAVVWGQSIDCAHMPNERASLEHMEHEIQVFALMMQG